MILIAQEAPAMLRAVLTSSIDSGVHDFFVDHRPNWVVDIAKFLDRFGSSEILLVVAVIIAVTWLARVRTTKLAIAVPTSIVVNMVIVAVLKKMVDRPRPDIAQQLVEATSASLPSGHTASAAALVTAILLVRSRTTDNSRRWTVLDYTLVAFALVSGVARLVLGVHWLSDVLAGWFIGVLISIVTVHIASKILLCRPNTN